MNKIIVSKNAYYNNIQDTNVLLYILFFIYVPSFGSFPVLPVSCPIPDFYADIPCYLGFYERYRAWRTVGGEGGGSPVWLGGLYVFVRGVNRVCNLTC